MFTCSSLSSLNGWKKLFLSAFTFFILQTGFTQLNFNVSNLTGLHPQCVNPTTLQFGPDGKLYVGTEGGRLFVYTVSKTGTNSYAITGTQVIYLVAQIPNYNDDGTPDTEIFETRQVTGILVTGTAANPVLYVSSSDPRVGGGGTAGDLNLDTNSGTISKLTWNGSSWEKVDIVRGLPRSEENHAVNGLQLDKTTNSLYIAVGGITNAGAPSNNFAFLTEYALSAAILKVDLNVINSLPVRGTGNNKYIYDLPTLNDPSRPDISNPDYNAALTGSPQTIDQGDPFGGNDGKNQAKVVPGGPVSIYSPGYRNAYDILIMKTGSRAGFMYTIDNGANDGWGGYPKNVGTAAANNDYDPLEPGSTSTAGTLGAVNNLDNLHLVSKPGMTPIYGGHPNPIRANPSGAGLYYHDGTTGSFLTSGAQLPADWPPVPQSSANPVEGNFLMPGETDNALTTFLTSTNGMAEYTSTNYFNGQLTGDILTADFLGKIWRVKLSNDGTQVLSKEVFASGFGEIALDVTTQGNGEIFDGTVWACDYTGSKIYIFTPDAGTVNCTGNTTSTTLDDDGDGYSNKDETDNGTDPCNPVSIPADFDNDKLSDKNDTDDDNDGITDKTDAFHKDAQNGQTTATTLQYPFLNNNPGTGLFGLGFTGLMSNGSTDPDKLYDIDNPGLVMGGAVGLASFPAGQGTALNNTQLNGFQFGYKTGSGAPAFEVQAALVAPFFNGLTSGQLNENHVQGIYIGTGDQDNYLMAALSGATGGGTPGIRIRLENNGTLVKTGFVAVPNILTAGTVHLALFVNPSTGKITVKYSSNLDATWYTIESDIQLSGTLLAKLQGTDAVALGLIASSGNATTYSARYDFMNVLAPAPLVLTPIEDIELNINPPNKTLNLSANFSDDEGLANITLSVAGNSNTTLVTSATVSGKNLILAIAAGKTGTAKIKVRATDSDGYWVDDEFEVNVVAPPPASSIRINSGGPALSMGGWIADQYFVGGETYAEWIPIANTTNDVMYQDERWGNFQYKVPVPNGKYKVVLHFVEIYWTEGGHRLFNVDIENGQGILTNYDIWTEAGGMSTAVAKEFNAINVTDGFVDIDFISVSDNAKISGIEIIPITGPTLKQSIVDQEANINTATKTVNLANLFTDDGGAANITLTVSGNTNPTLIKSAVINGTTLTLGITAGEKGFSLIKIKGTDADGLFAEDEFKITVVDPTPPNTKPTVANPVADITVNMNAADKSISLANVFADDKAVSALTLTVVSNNNAALVKSTTITGTTLKLSFTAAKTGSALIKLRATDAEGLYIDDEFKVTVVDPTPPNTKPTVANALTDIVLAANPADKTVSIANVFADDKGATKLKYSIANNSNTALVKSAVLTGTSLKLSFTAGKSGFALIKIRATDAEGLYVDDEFRVTVQPPPPPVKPTVATPLPDISVNMNAAVKSISIAKVFADDEGLAQLKYTVVSNSNPAVVKSAILTGTTLKLSFVTGKSGYSIVKIRATDSDGLYIDDDFRITVLPPAIPPTVVKPIPDQSTFVNAGNIVLNISQVFGDDKGSANLKYLIASNSNAGLVTTTLSGTTLTLSPATNATGTATIKVQATDADGLKVLDDFKVNISYNSILINSGGPQIVLEGRTWLKDYFYDDGASDTDQKNISNTTNDVLYQSIRKGNFDYSIPVPNGTYTVKLHFAERNERWLWKRLFNVFIEKNQGVLKNYDIVAEAGGADKAVVETFNNIRVSDGRLTIDFNRVTDDAVVSGIEIIPITITNKPPVLSKAIADQWYFMNSPDKEIDLSDHFADDQGEGGLEYSIRSNADAKLVVLGFNDDGNWRVNEGDRNGSANLEMDFAKNKTGTSVIRLRATDLLGLFVEDEFKVELGLIDPNAPKEYRINAGGEHYFYGTEEWIGDESYNGGSVYQVWLPIGNTSNDRMYQDMRYGKKFSYNIPIMKGTFNVVLHFAEVGLSYKNGRIFNVSMERGQGKLNNYDIFAKWGNDFTAAKETFNNITVTDGYLDIDFEGVKDNAVVSGIEIFEVKSDDDNRLAVNSSFDATAADTTARLNWTTQAEQSDETLSVSIERSEDGENFHSIASIDGSGTKTGKAGNFTDLSPIVGLNYYRLKFSNVSGASTYSEIRTVTIKPRLYGLMVYPNPNLNGIVFAELGRQDREQIKVRLMDINGKLIPVNQNVERTSQVLIKIKLPAAIAKGIYILEIQANGKTYHNRLVVQ